ncbi:hypothetical protein KFK09_027842 [Dendrobium nobile]|uniref:Dof zinc finger protein n=1 Tax=Dendrobium nobile TaxID=94219 RepID=A0A8T3A1U0_DENNO|nr:hypothetical protein KFK09_027842 [Dendrobium nobile]
MQGTTMTAFMASRPPLTEPEQNLPCPRCESTNTKFCYYNNYNLSQPRHFCKDCRRYWTKGGTLRNVPVGGGTRKNSKRSLCSSGAASPSASGGVNSKRPSPSSSAGEVKNSELFSSSIPTVDNDHRMLDMTGSFSSLLSSTAQFGNFFECFQSLDSLPILKGVTRPMLEPEVQSPAESSGNESAAAARPPVMPENFLSLPGDTSSWAGGWPDLSIYTPGRNFQ